MGEVCVCVPLHACVCVCRGDVWSSIFQNISKRRKWGWVKQKEDRSRGCRRSGRCKAVASLTVGKCVGAQLRSLVERECRGRVGLTYARASRWQLHQCRTFCHSQWSRLSSEINGIMVQMVDGIVSDLQTHLSESIRWLQRRNIWVA